MYASRTLVVAGARLSCAASSAATTRGARRLRKNGFHELYRRFKRSTKQSGSNTRKASASRRGVHRSKRTSRRLAPFHLYRDSARLGLRAQHCPPPYSRVTEILRRLSKRSACPRWSDRQREPCCFHRARCRMDHVANREAPIRRVRHALVPSVRETLLGGHAMGNRDDFGRNRTDRFSGRVFVRPARPIGCGNFSKRSPLADRVLSRRRV